MINSKFQFNKKSKLSQHKQSKEKIDILRALGAEVHVCPTDVSPEDPRSYYSVARKLNAEIPNSFFILPIIIFIVILK